MKSIIALTLAILVIFSGINAQEFSRLDISISTGGNPLDLALAGGINSPQLSAVDFNNDQIQDLFIFDRTGDKAMAFLHDGTPNSINYTFAPEYLENFPPLNSWVLLRDYNNDGVMDIFARPLEPGVDGIMVFRGFYTDNKINFERIDFPIAILGFNFNVIPYFPPGQEVPSQVYVSKIDYPAVDDVDCDGDLDILTFTSSGKKVQFYANQSVEKGYGLDSLIFELANDCWGDFIESGVSSEVTLSDVPGDCVENLVDNDIEIRHAGSTLLTFDADNDNDKELVLGDLLGSNLVYLTNGGTCEAAWMSDQDIVYPDYNVSVDIPVFLASFYLDINHDGKKDFVVAANNRLNAEDDELWYYENTESNEFPTFNLVKKDLLLDEMVDLGSGANPTFVDYNADGLLDIVVGNFSFYEPFGAKNASLFLFKNTGTKHAPTFELIDDDYLNMNQFSSNAYNFSPAFGDLDNDGDLDILVGEENGQLFYAENTAGEGNPIAFGPFSYAYQGINIGLVSVPFIVDLDKDGLMDIVLGEKKGNINFFKNIGTPTEPNFDSDPDIAPNNFFLGEVDTRVSGSSDGYSAPWVVEVDGEYLFFTGTEIGRIELYNNVEGQIYGSFNAVDETLGAIDAGDRVRPAVVDIDQDGWLDLLVGSFRGGLSWFKTDIASDFPTAANEPTTPDVQLQLGPNPANSSFQVNIKGTDNQTKLFQLFNNAGQLLETQKFEGNQLMIQSNKYPSGIYIVKVTVGEHSFVEKMILE